MLFFAISSLLAIAVPALVLRLWTRRSMTWSLFLAVFGLGAAGWLLAKIPKGLVMLTIFYWKGISLQMNEAQLEAILRANLWLLLVGAVCAGVFEEVFKPAGLLAIRGVLKGADAVVVGWVAGVGAGLLEALNFIAGAWIKVELGMSSYAEVANVPFERALVVLFHGALTAIFVPAVVRRRYLVATIPVVIHIVVDFVVPWFQLKRNFDSWAADAVLLIFVIVTFTAEQIVNGNSRRVRPAAA